MTGARTSGGRTPWSDFMLGQATQPARAIPTTKTGINNHNFHYFIQDDWKLSDRLTLNLGLRYEYFQQWRGRLANFDLATGRQLLSVSPDFCTQRGLIKGQGVLCCLNVRFPTTQRLARASAWPIAWVTRQ
jgi:outer membrane receptor protein involved in Fe transport